MESIVKARSAIQGIGTGGALNQRQGGRHIKTHARLYVEAAQKFAHRHTLATGTLQLRQIYYRIHSGYRNTCRRNSDNRA